MTDDLDALISGLRMMIADYSDASIHDYYHKILRESIASITALSAQLAEVRAGAQEVLRIQAAANKLDEDRADRAEAALAAQIEAEPVAWRWESCANSQGWNTRYGCEKPTPSYYITDIVPLYATQPHDRTALDRMQAEAKAKALRDAVEAMHKVCRKDPMPSVGRVEAAILAMIPKEGA